MIYSFKGRRINWLITKWAIFVTSTYRSLRNVPFPQIARTAAIYGLLDGRIYNGGQAHKVRKKQSLYIRRAAYCYRTRLPAWNQHLLCYSCRMSFRTVSRMREKKTHIYVDSQERSILLNSLVELKNQLIRQGKYGDCVDELIFKVANAPVKKVKIEYV